MPSLREIVVQDSVHAAPQLLGAILVRGTRRARIIEVEAYMQHEPGSHSFRGQTLRNQQMFGPAGFAYVYFTYGNHWMLNIVTGPESSGQAVLIRAAHPLCGLEKMRKLRPKAKVDEDLLSGPGKLAAAFSVDSKDNGLDLLDPRSDIHLIYGDPPAKILVGPRIGLAQGKGDDLPWRFVDEDALCWASRPIRALA